MQALNRVDAATASAPVMALRGWIVYREEPTAAMRWFEQSIARFASEEDPTGEMQRVATAAIDAAIDTARFDAAAKMLRVRAGSSDPSLASTASLHLLALHADHGPLEGFEDDLEALRLSIGEPLMLIGTARLQDRAGRQLLASGLRRVATAGLVADADELFNAADQLVHVGWSNEAVPLLESAVDRAMADGLELLACNAHLRLSRIARHNARPLSAARHLERAFELGGGGVFIRTDRLGNSTPWTDDEVRTEIAWLYLEAARQEGDAAEVDRRIDALLPLAHIDSSITLALLVLLHERDRHGDMRPLFDRARAVLQRTLDAAPDDPAALNNLAWLMARSGMDVDGALPLARRAVQLRPESAGYLDTLAEATFRSGDVEGAIRFQTRALELRPGDAFLTQQLERFRNTKPNRIPLPSDD
jgi:tetratricopeptide (TPR) repeat protein